MPDLESERQRLRELARSLVNGLSKTRFANLANPANAANRSASESISHIVSIPVGEPQAAVELQQHLQSVGINVACIRPPTVAAGTARLRASLSARHTQEDVDRLVSQLVEQACQAIVPKV